MPTLPSPTSVQCASLIYCEQIRYCAAVSNAALESANIVGYNTASVTGGKMNLLCVSWETVGNTQGKATLNDVIDTSVLTSYSADASTAGDYIDTWDMENGNWGTRYFYVDQAVAWGDAAYADTWMNGNFEPCNPAVDAGSAFWLYANNDIADLKFCGQVAKSASSYTLTAGKMNLCANPTPSVLNLIDGNQVVLTGATSYSADASTAGDYIDTWDLATGNWGPRYFYVNQSTWGAEYVNTWMDGNFMPVQTTGIPEGTGFWYFANAAVTLTFPGQQ